jgi:hypothetical protein
MQRVQFHRPSGLALTKSCRMFRIRPRLHYTNPALSHQKKVSEPRWFTGTITPNCWLLPLPVPPACHAAPGSFFFSPLGQGQIWENEFFHDMTWLGAIYPLYQVARSFLLLNVSDIPLQHVLQEWTHVCIIFAGNRSNCAALPTPDNLKTTF